MQRQHVNLLQDVLFERKIWVSAQQMLAVIILTLALVVGWSYWQHYRLMNTHHTHTTLVAQVARTQQDIEAIEARIVREPDPRLQREVNRMQAELQHLQALQGVAFEPFAQTQLAEFLRGVGRQRPEGLWLTYIHIGTSGRDVVLEDTTVDAKLLPNFITALGLEQVFFGMAFREVRLKEETSDDATELHFRLVAGCEHNRCGGMP